MPLPSAKAEITWKEPWLFQIRTSSRLAWLMRAGFFAVVYVVFVVAIIMDSGKPNRRQLGIAEKAVMPAVVAAVFLVLFELPNLQRIVSVTSTQISCMGGFMMFGGPIHLITGMRQWNCREIRSVQLLRTGEPDNEFPFGLMIVTPKHAAARRLGVPATTSLDDVADRIHAMGVAVQLSNWQPKASKDNAALAAT
jgi:hypothetical protein